jgi:hypothetical protein
MALIPIVAQSDGQLITVNSLVKSPTIIPRQIISMLQDEFIIDSVLRRAQRTASGVYQYNESDPLFANEGSTIRSEFGEYKMVETSEGQLVVVTTVDRGLGFKVSDEMRRRNQMDRVNTQMTMIKNTLLRDWETAFMTALQAAAIPTTPASAVWTTTTTDIRKDIVGAKRAISTATYSLQTNSFFTFRPNMMVCSYATADSIVLNDSFGSVYRGNIASESVRYKGKLPNQIMDLDVMRSRFWPDQTVMILERGTLGFVGDEEPLQSLPLQRNERDRTYWTRANRSSAIGIDQPKAAIIITGVAA